jgi:hypothetical protein
MMSSQESPDDDFHYPAEPIEDFKHKCACGWEDCRRYQQFFTDRLNKRVPEYRGGLCRHLDLSGNQEKQVAWRKAVLSNIFGTARDWSNVYVARHHWTAEQNKFFDQTKKRLSTPLPRSVVKNMSAAFDEEDKIMTDNGPLFFNTPNVPLAVIKKEVESSLKRSERASKRQEASEAAMAEKAAKREERLENERERKYRELTYEQFLRMNNNFVLQSEEIRRLRRENKELKQKADKAALEARNEIEQLEKKLQTKEDSRSFGTCRWRDPALYLTRILASSVFIRQT